MGRLSQKPSVDPSCRRRGAKLVEDEFRRGRLLRPQLRRAKISSWLTVSDVPGTYETRGPRKWGNNKYLNWGPK